MDQKHCASCVWRAEYVASDDPLDRLSFVCTHNGSPHYGKALMDRTLVCLCYRRDW